MPIKSRIRTIPNYPKDGIMFRDVTTLFKDAEGFRVTMERFIERYKHNDVDMIVGVEARGFILGAALAAHLGLGFVPIRKKGKLPAETISTEYELEYGVDTIEIHKDAIEDGQKIVLVDDLIATGGTALGACELIEQLGGEVVEAAFIINLPDLGGAKKLIQKGISTFSLVEYEGD